MASINDDGQTKKLLPRDIINMVRSYNQYNYMNVIDMEADEPDYNEYIMADLEFYKETDTDYESQNSMLEAFYKILIKLIYLNKKDDKYIFYSFDRKSGNNKYEIIVDKDLYKSYEIMTKILIISYILNKSYNYLIKINKHTITCNQIEKTSKYTSGLSVVCCSSELFKFFDIRSLIADYYSYNDDELGKYIDIYGNVIEDND